ncbi:MAG: hypothetical protein IIX17_04950 [Tidjanibacter sp.]|nr:hypothetical protein [Tidjanibacter sp.]
MKEQRAKVKGVNLGRLRSIGNLGKTIFNTLLVIIGISGLGITLVESTNEI